MQLNFITVYHPQTDSQTKRVNQVLEDMLRMFIMYKLTKWEVYLPLVEFSYNNRQWEALGMSPFEVLYCRKCRTLIHWDGSVSRIIIGPDMVQEMKQQIIRVRQHLKMAQDRQKSYTNLKRMPR